MRAQLSRRVDSEARTTRSASRPQTASQAGAALRESDDPTTPAPVHRAPGSRPRPHGRQDRRPAHGTPDRSARLAKADRAFRLSHPQRSDPPALPEARHHPRRPRPRGRRNGRHPPPDRARPRQPDLGHRQGNRRRTRHLDGRARQARRRAKSAESTCSLVRPAELTEADRERRWTDRCQDETDLCRRSQGGIAEYSRSPLSKGRCR